MEEYTPISSPVGNPSLISLEHREAIRILLLRFLREYAKRPGSLLSSQTFVNELYDATGYDISKQIINDLLDEQKKRATNPRALAHIRDYVLRHFADVDPKTVGGSVTQQVAYALRNLIGRSHVTPGIKPRMPREVRLTNADETIILRVLMHVGDSQLSKGTAGPVVPAEAELTILLKNEFSQDSRAGVCSRVDFNFKGHLAADEDRLIGPMIENQHKVSVMLILPLASQRIARVILVQSGGKAERTLEFLHLDRGMA